MARQKVLLVDDDANVRSSLQRRMQREGFLVQTADGGAAALAFAAEGRADLVILDLLMPAMDGFTTCERLRSMPGWTNTPVLILSGARTEDAYRRALACGADDFLDKPIDPRELLFRAHSLIRIGELVSALRESAGALQAQRETILRDRRERAKLDAFFLHDLKNPITSLLLKAEMMVDASEDPGAWREVLDWAHCMRKLVVGWMDQLGSEASGIRAAPVPVDVEALLRGVLDQHALWVRVRDLRARVAVEEAGPQALDPSLMERVVGNLLDNCIRFSPPGGELVLDALQGEDGGLLIRVADRGPGIPPESRERIFDLFAQLEPRVGGDLGRENRGLGLAFSKAAVEAHGGCLFVEDHPGGGARFVIRLPALREASA
jgi:signal transduction histidine kinase